VQSRHQVPGDEGGDEGLAHGLAPSHPERSAGQEEGIWIGETSHREDREVDFSRIIGYPNKGVKHAKDSSSPPPPIQRQSEAHES
jgi:hypothetical protein